MGGMRKMNGSFWSRIRHEVTEAVYPPTCAGCGLRGTWLCDLCEQHIPRLRDLPLCDRCGIPRWKGRCGCPTLHRNLVTVRSVYPYGDWLPNAIHAIKYEDEFARAEMFGEQLAEEITALGPVDALVPVPLHPKKQRDRGYNQAEKLAIAAARHLEIPVKSVVVRRRHTVSQVTLSGRERASNMDGAFALDPADVPSWDARFVLIDDVRTTGSTLNACATALAGAGITRVTAVTVAADLFPEHLAYVMELGGALRPAR